MHNISKEDLDMYLLELAKHYKRKNRKNIFPIELIIVGGASIVLNYEFRYTTLDVDCLMNIGNQLKESIIYVADKFNLPSNWVNDDFKRTQSYTYKLNEYSVFYKNYLNVLNVRTIKDEYLIAMKIVSNRKYKNDLSDIIGIIDSNNELSIEKIGRALNDLYGKKTDDFKDVIIIIETYLKNKVNGRYKELFNKEEKNKIRVINEINKRKIDNINNLDDIIKELD